jgi:hypothetical protein
MEEVQIMVTSEFGLRHCATKDTLSGLRLFHVCKCVLGQQHLWHRCRGQVFCPWSK